MQSVTSNAVSNAISWSYNEHQVGYWLGRKRYEKTLYVGIPAYSTALYSISMPLNETGIVTVVEIDGVLIKGSYDNPSFVMKIPYTFINSADNKWLNIYVYYNKPTNSLQLSVGGNYQSGYYGNSEVYITVKYIKSTTIET